MPQVDRRDGVPTLHLTPLDATYPSRLRRLASPPATLSVRGGSVEADCVVAVIGSRAAHPDAEEFASFLAAALARRGVVVASGGALGIDAAAHRGALGTDGRTWAVAGTGCRHCFPPEHEALFERIGQGPSAMLWPFEPSHQARPGSFVARNRVLVGLSDAVVVVQAGLHSGALKAAAIAIRLGRPLWVVPAPPWLGPAFAGSRQLLEQGARALHSIEALMSSLESRLLTPSVSPNVGHSLTGSVPSRGPARGAVTPRPGSELHARSQVDRSVGHPDSRPKQAAIAEVVSGLALPRRLSEDETAVLAATSTVPLHLDEIASRAHSAAPAAMVALLTLALDDVVVEGPPGFFRRKTDRKR